MDSKLYMDAAVEGNIEPFKEISRRDLELMVTPIRNTILHINILSRSRQGSSTVFVEGILDICPSLLLQVNVNGETPLHVAAKCGKSEMVEILIKRANAQHGLESGIEAAKLMLRMTDSEGNTALHKAVQCQHLDVLKILTKEDPDFTYTFNDRGETPLYLAAAKASLEMVDEILKTCTTPAHEGPNQMTALHAATWCLDGEMTRKLIRKLLEKKVNLIKETDGHGWTPLHHAAYSRNAHAMETLLERDLSAAYMKDNYREMTPLHLAVGRRYIPYKIISACPDCCELVDARGWNVLHLAMLALHRGDLKTLLGYQVIRNLTHKKDVDGNTPFHLLAAVRPFDLSKLLNSKVNGLKGTGIEVLVNDDNMSVSKVAESGSPWLKESILKMEKASGPYGNGVVMVAKEDRKDIEQERELIQKLQEPHLIVATLIATVTFTAAFTLPGGVIQEGLEKGNAILSKSSAFQAFVITDAIAMLFSLSAVFAHFLLSIQTLPDYFFLYHYASISILIAIGAMVIAFATGTYAVLTTVLWLAIVTSSIGLTFFIFVFIVLRRMRKARE